MRVLRLLLKGLLLVVPLALLLVQVNYAVDGSAILRGDKYELEIATAWLEGKAVGNFDNTINERSVMRLYVENLDAGLGTLVLGSSRAMQITAAIAGEEGAFFNSGMTGADRKDVFSTFYLFDRADKLPRNLIIAADPWLLFDSDATLNFRSDDNLYREFLRERLGYEVEYVEEDDSVRREALVSFAYFQENIVYHFTDHSSDVMPDILPDQLLDYDYDIRTSDGTQYYSAEFRNREQGDIDIDALALTGVDFPLLYGFTEVSAELARQFEDFLAYAESRGVQVTLVFTPFHPTYWDKLVADANYSAVSAAEQTFRDIAARTGADVYGAYNPAEANCTNEDFYDGLHIRRESIGNYFPGMGKELPPPESPAEETPTEAE